MTLAAQVGEKVTDEMVVLMACVAIRHSQSMGMGMLKYDQTDDFIRPQKLLGVTGGLFTESLGEKTIRIDYFNGRMVKFHAKKTGVTWEFWPDPPHREYQDWSRRYPTYEDLYIAALYLKDEIDRNGE